MMKIFKQFVFPGKLALSVVLIGFMVLKTSEAYGQFVQIESILVDACDGTDEGKNEMIRFRTESLPINVADIRVDGANSGTFQTGKWPTVGNSFQGWITPGTAAYDSAVSKVAIINTSIINCGKLIIPTGGTNNQGVIPAGKKAIIITGYTFTPTANDFSLLSDTIYVLFHNADVIAGNFGNYLPASGNTASQLTRKLRLWQISTGLSDEVTYYRNLLVDQLGVPGTADGAGVRYTDAGVATYYNDGCQAPYIPLSAAWTTTSICQSATALDLTTLLAATATTGGTWSGTGVTGTSFNPAGLSGNISVTYTVGSPSCSISEIHNINVITSALATWTPPASICQSAAALNLTTLLAATATAGGTWSGTGVTGTSFNPSGLLGNISITYTVGTTPCVTTEIHNINIITSALATWTPPTSICQSAAALNLTTLLAGTATAGGTWSGTGVTGTSFNPAGLSGNINITYIAGTAPCSATESHIISVVASAVSTWTAPAPICQSAAALNLNTLLAGTATAGGTWSGNGVSGTSFNPAGLIGNISVTYTVGTTPCTSTETHNINVITSAVATWSAPATICQSDAALNLTTLLDAASTPGGTWSGSGVTGTSFSPSGLSGNITLTYTAGTAPCSAFEDHIIQVLTSSNAAWTAPVSICADGAPIDLLLLVTGDAGGTWSGNGVSGTIFNPAGLSGNIAINYLVNPANSCPDNVSHAILVNAVPNPSWSAPSVICKTQSTFDLNTLVNGTTGGTWSGNGVNSNLLDLSVVGNELDVTYTVSNNGCSSASTATLHFSAVEASFTISPTTGVAPLNASTTNLSQNAASYYWNFGNGLNSSEENPSTQFLYEGTYYIWLTATSALGCKDSTYQMVIIEESPDYIPNVFTPNEDMINEEFYPVISKVTENYHMMVFNRWGELIFETAQQAARWDGKYHNELVPMGVYFYVINYHYNNRDYYYNGSVTVVR